MYKLLLSVVIIMAYCLLLTAWSACKKTDATPYSCTSAAMQVEIGGKNLALRVTNNTLFRSRTDTGKFKLLSMEALSDSLRLVLNVKDGPYDETPLQTDALERKTYTFKRGTTQNNGLLVIGIRSNGSYRFADTDTSAIVVTKISAEDHLISGTYYFEADNQAIIGKGTFNNVCFSSLK